jgi:hypothetical protein
VYIISVLWHGTEEYPGNVLEKADSLYLPGISFETRKEYSAGISLILLHYGVV